METCTVSQVKGSDKQKLLLQQVRRPQTMADLCAPSAVAASRSCLSCCQAQKQDSSRMMPTAPAMMPADTCDAIVGADTMQYLQQRAGDR